MGNSNQTQFDLKTPEGRQQFTEWLHQSLSPEAKRYFEAAFRKQETDADKAEVRRREEEERNTGTTSAGSTIWSRTTTGGIRAGKRGGGAVLLTEPVDLLNRRNRCGAVPIKVA